MTYVQIAVAVLVAVLGIVNTLTVSITDRRRELGVLQAVGGLRNQIRQTIWMEAVTIGAIGVILGLAFGALQLYLQPCDRRPRTSRACGSSTNIPTQIALRAAAGDSWRRRLSRPSARRNRRCAARWWRRSNMNRTLLVSGCWPGWRSALAQDARQIVAEAQNRHASKSQQYEGTLEVMGSSKKVSLKRWIYQRIGSYGASRTILRFTAPPEVKGVALLIVNHPDRASDQWMWTPGHRARPAHRAAGPLHALLRHRLQLRGSGRARRRPVRLQAARRRTDRRRGVLEDRVEAEGAKSSQYTSTRSSGSARTTTSFARIENYNKDKLVRRVRLHAISKRCRASGRRAPPRSTTSRREQPHRAEAREAAVQRAAEGRRFHACRRCGVGRFAQAVVPVVCLVAFRASAQNFTQRGFLETSPDGVSAKPAPNDSGHAVGESLFRYDASYKLTAVAAAFAARSMRESTRTSRSSARCTSTGRTGHCAARPSRCGDFSA